MTNEEKANDICAKYRVSKLIPTEEECIAHNAALEMAEWKDYYYKKLLDLLVKSGADHNIITNYIKNCIEL